MLFRSLGSVHVWEAFVPEDEGSNLTEMVPLTRWLLVTMRIVKRSSHRSRFASHDVVLFSCPRW